MASASSTALAVFLATVILVVGMIVAAIRTSFPDAWAKRATFLILMWVVIPGAAAASGAIDTYDPLPAPALLILAFVTISTVGLSLSSFGARIAARVPLALLVGYQVFRVAVEWTLHRLFVDGVVPVEMTYTGRNFDVVSGATALVVGIWIARGRPPKAAVLAWNVLGLALLLNIIVVAILCTPVPFRAFHDGPPNLLPSTFPFVWLPTVLVQAALAGHILVFRALAAKGTSRA